MLIQAIPYPASSWPVPVASTQWRIYVTATQGNGWISLSEVEMRGSVGGADQCSGGTPSASVGSTPTNVFDNNTGTFWQSGSNTFPIWIRYTFASPVYVHEVSMRIASGLNDGPHTFSIQYYDGASWITVRSFTNFRWVNTAQQITFPLYQNYSASQAAWWRLKTTAKQNSGSFDAWAELQFRKVSGGADVTQASYGYASTTELGSSANNAFDGSTANRWASNTGSLGSWIANYIGVANAGEIVEIVATSSSTANDSVTGFDVQYWNSEEWITHWSVSTTSWSATQTRTFTKP